MSEHLINNLISQVEQHIHGPAREQILSQLEQNPTADTAARITYDLIISLDSQADKAGRPVEIDVIMAVATETIDMLVEIMQAMGIKLNPDELREETLLKIVLLHMEAVDGDPAEKAAAQELLAAMTEDGSLDMAMNHINEKASASPEQMQAAGASMAAPQQKPLAAGVQQGLME